jgi:transposase
MTDHPRKYRRKFTSDYKREAAHLVIDTGRPIQVVANEIDVKPQTLGNWVRAERSRLGPEGVHELSESERAELDRLREEVRGLRMDNEFLGKASAYFASRITTTSVSR